MASLSYEDRGGKRKARVWFEVYAKRKSIRLGEVSKRAAENVLSHVRELETCSKLADSPATRTRDWLNKIDDDVHQKLADSGLIKVRERRTVSEFFNQWAKSTDVSDRSRRNRRNTVTKVIEIFGADTLLNDVTPEMADKFFDTMKERYALAHANKLAKRTRQVFNKAIRLKIIHENPFEDLRIGDEVNKARQVFVDQKTINKVIDEATDNEFKLIIALARYGGLRIPSEIVGLKWGHVNWEASRIEITDVKRKLTRIIPIFAELRPYLDACWDDAGDDAVFITPSYRSADANLRTRLLRTIKRAGVTPWPKLWQNLRSSRETELADIYPIQVVVAWIGNSVAVAKKHYLQVTDNHFQQAIGAGDESAAMGAEGGAESAVGADMVQSPQALTSAEPEKQRSQRTDKAPTSFKTPPTDAQRNFFPHGKIRAFAIGKGKVSAQKGSKTRLDITH